MSDPILQYDLLKSKLVEIRRIQEELKFIFLDQNRNFTMDGRMVGDFGEIIAHLHYDLELDPRQRAKYDACKGDMQIQIKATMQDALTFKNPDGHYLGLRINPDGTFDEIYNGPARFIYEHFKGRKHITSKLLRFPNDVLHSISENIPKHEKIGRRKSDERN